jgi:hypothetical protein
VQDSWTRRDAFQLRHLCYSAEGYIDARPSAEFSDRYDFGPGSDTVVLYEGSDPVGSVRVCRAEAGGSGNLAKLPLAETFPEAYAELFARGSRAMEINRLVAHPRYAQDPGLVYTLIRMASFLVRRYDPDFVGICVRPNHVGFWKRLRFHHVDGPRVYEGLKFPTDFLVLPREKCDLIKKVVPVLRISPVEEAAYERLLRGETVPVFGHE